MIGELMAWINKGGAPPWRSLDAESCSYAIYAQAAQFEAELAIVKRDPGKFRWPDFIKVDQSWIRFESIYKLCLCANNLRFKGFEIVSFLAEEERKRLLCGLASCRRLAQATNGLKRRPGLALWQSKAVQDFGLGALASVPKKTRTRQQTRKAQIEKMERLCATNVSMSLDISPVWTDKRKDLKGLPVWLIDKARQRAVDRRWRGWAFTANAQEYVTFMGQADSREMRRQMYQARSKAGSEFASAYDNTMLAKKLLAARRALAKEDGFDSYAHWVVSDHMLGTPERVEAALLAFAAAATPRARTERQSLDEWMRNHHGISRLEPWDYRYARNKLQWESVGGAVEQASQYFAPAGTIERSVSACASFLNVKSRRCRERERDDLIVFEITSSQGFYGHITIAPKARSADEELCPHEWTLCARSDAFPVEPSSVVLLQLESSGGRLMSLSHMELVTLFHELGHAFHAVLGVGRHSGDSPVGLQEDAWEMHSQLLERLAWEPRVLMEVGRRKGKRMPRQLAEKIASCRNFHSAAWTIAQVTEALCDLRLHSQFNPKGRILPWEVMVAIKKVVGVDAPKSYNRQGQQLRSLAGQYVCSDYSYLWTEGLAHKLFTTWNAQAQSVRGAKRASESLRGIFFDRGARAPLIGMVNKYVKVSPKAVWLA